MRCYKFVAANLYLFLFKSEGESDLQSNHAHDKLRLSCLHIILFIKYALNCETISSIDRIKV